MRIHFDGSRLEADLQSQTTWMTRLDILVLQQQMGGLLKCWGGGESETVSERSRENKGGPSQDESWALEGVAISLALALWAFN